MVTFGEEAVSEVISGHVSERSTQLGLHYVRYRHAAEVYLLSPALSYREQNAGCPAGWPEPGIRLGFAWS